MTSKGGVVKVMEIEGIESPKAPRVGFFVAYRPPQTSPTADLNRNSRVARCVPTERWIAGLATSSLLAVKPLRRLN